MLSPKLDMTPGCSAPDPWEPWEPPASNRVDTNTTFTRAYNSMGGCDISAWQGGFRVATMQGIAYNIYRDQAPIYTMGVSDPKEFARGKRIITGSTVFVQLDENTKLNPEELLDIKVRAANEYGGVAVIEILGVELMKDGYALTEKDVELERSYNFVAQRIIPWRMVENPPEEQKSPHEGMVYNPYTDSWSWL